MTANPNGEWISAGPVEKIQAQGYQVVAGADRPLAVFWHEGRFYALDNRCPHLGFPLHRGSMQDGILTCPWHHARFDLASGCTFDLFADDCPSFPLEIRDGQVWVRQHRDPAAERTRHGNRLRVGMEQNIGLIQCKSILGLLSAGADYQDIVRQVALYGTRFRDGWASGLTILACMANLVPYCDEEQRYLALSQGVRRAAADCAGQVPRREREPLASDDIDFAQLERWLRYWVLVRHRDGAERTVRTAIEHADNPGEVAKLLFSAVTDRFHADTGHALDFINKALETLDLIGWVHAADVLPSLVPQLAGSRGGEEQNAWRHPIDLVPLLNAAFEELPGILEEGAGKHGGPTPAALAEAILDDDPGRIIEALKAALREGLHPVDAGRAVAYAAALRIARFGSSNEFGDWIEVLHTFSACNALHQGLKRLDRHGLLSSEPVRGLFHGAMVVYLDRFLNVPPARLPGERDRLDDQPAEADQLRARFLANLDTQQSIDEAGRIVARYLSLGHPVGPLIGTFTHAVAREDADFHTFQVVEAGVRQYHEWRGSPEGANVLVAVARYLAAHSPTQRGQLQTAQIALRLHRGEALYEEAAEEDEPVPAGV